MNGFSDMFTGGQCGADSLQTGQMSTNPLKNFMGQMVNGNHEITNTCPFANQISKENDMNMVMQGFENTWANSDKMVYDQMQNEQILMEQAFVQAHIHDKVMMDEMMTKSPNFQQNWTNAEQNQMQEQWADELHHQIQEEKMNEMEGIMLESEKKVEDELREESPALATNDLMETMMIDPDPKFRNSKFLHFIQQINKGNFEIKDDELIKHKEEPLEMMKEKEGLGIKQWTDKTIGDDMDILDEMEDAFTDSTVVIDKDLNKEADL